MNQQWIIQHCPWNVTAAQEDGKPTGTWGFMKGFKWLRIQGHIPSYLSVIFYPQRAGDFPQRGNFILQLQKGERESSEALQLMKSSTQGNTNCLKSRGWFFLEHLDC